MALRFDGVLDVVRSWVAQQPAGALSCPPQSGALGGAEIVFVRDLRGRVRVAVDWTRSTTKAQQPDWAALHQALEAFSPGNDVLVCFRDQLVKPREVFLHPDLRPLNPGQQNNCFVLERQLVGTDWLHRGPEMGETENFKRVTFFGLKGGVGRSTALAMLGLHLAELGKKVLVIDLDLESPGIGSLLLNGNALSQYGVVDWFVEDAVGKADSQLLTSMVVNGVEGIRVAPAFGTDTGGYLYKLSRSYLDGQSPTFETFTQRLRRMVESLEAQESPDFVLIDSRGGIHDRAAAVVTQMKALSLLFASDSRQTWDGYRLLFSHWKSHPDAAKTFRENLKMVHALSPGSIAESQASDQLMRQRSHQLFVDTIYENVAPGTDGFSFTTEDSDGPHFPLPIRWSDLAKGLDPVASPETAKDDQVKVLFKDFINGVTSLLGL